MKKSVYSKVKRIRLETIKKSVWVPSGESRIATELPEKSWLVRLLDFVERRGKLNLNFLTVGKLLAVLLTSKRPNIGHDGLSG